VEATVSDGPRHVTIDGDDVPTLGLGTWRLTGETCYEAVRNALEMGYRHVDTAARYKNEREVGRAIADSDVDREDVFLTTKVWGIHASESGVHRSARKSLERLGVDQVDLLLIHWPNPLVPVGETVGALAACRAEGLTRHVGVSNYSQSRLRAAMAECDAPIFADQVQMHPHRSRRSLREFCREEDVMLTAYSPLMHGGAMTDDVLAEVAAGYDKTPAQVCLRWVIQHENVVAIPKATSEAHQRENLDIFDFSLGEEEMARIERPSLLRTVLGWVRGRTGL
jgi:diketogulonate reductase-like aldo/keto reductase